MAILSKPRLLAQERFELEDVNTLLLSLCADSEFWTKEFLANAQFILKGFQVTGLNGPSPATVVMTDATLINANNTGDFSWFVADPAGGNISTALTSGSRNYLELELTTDTGTPLTKAFWDPSAQGGLGAEFNQTINTVTSLKMTVVALLGGFSGSANRIPLAIVDTDGANNIKGILDKRPLFFRLGQPGAPLSGYPWASNTEPELLLDLTGVVGSFTVGETVTFSSGATAEVTTGGSGPQIGVILPSSDLVSAGATVTGGTSGATATLASFTDNFSGADKSIDNFRNLLAALQTEIRSIKGTRFWFETGFGSIAGLANFINTVVAPFSSTAAVSFDGSNVKITDSSGTPADADILAKIRIFGKSSQLNLTRQDGTGGSANIPLADGSVLYVELPASGNRTYDAVGAASTNYKTVARASFLVSDKNFWIAYREGTRLIVRGIGELEVGESVEIGDSVSNQLLAALGFTSDSPGSNVYSSNNVLSNGDSFLTALGKLDAASGTATSVAYQDRNTKLVRGGTWAWTSSTGFLSFTADAAIQVPGLPESRNNIPFSTQSPITLSADGQAAYVDINRTAGAAANLTVSVASISALTQNPDRVIIARRVGTDVILGNSSILLPDGTSRQVDQGTSVQTLALLGSGITEATSSPSYSSNIRGVSGEGFKERLGTLTDAIGDSQEDRSAYLRADSAVTWTGTALQFSDNIVLEIVNTKSGSVTQHSVASSNSPITLANGESAWVLVDRTQAAETLTLHLSNTLAIPAQTQANKDVFVLFRRKDAGASQVLHIPLHKQVLEAGQMARLGGAPSAATSSSEGLLTTDATSMSRTIVSGTTLTYPNLVISASDTITINGSLVGVNSITVNGTLVVNGDSRVL